MNKKQIVEVLSRLVAKEVANQLALMKMQIMSEVTGMIRYSEMNRLNEDTPKTDYERVQHNLNKMPGYRERVRPKVDESTQPLKYQEPRSYTKNKSLNDILNDTDPFSSDEMTSPSIPIGAMFSGDGAKSYDEPWDDVDGTPDIPREFKPVQSEKLPDTILGTDNKPVNLHDETVRNVLDIINNTDYKAKLKKLNEAGEQFRNMNPMAPTHNPNAWKDNG